MSIHGNLAAPPSLKEICVLVVDPRSTSRAITVKLLDEAGYTVQAVQTGNEALLLLSPDVQKPNNETRADVILKAHDPPDSNGIRFLQKLKEVKQTNSLPVIIIYSNYDDREVIMRCLSLGAVDYWTKPLRSNEIRNLWTKVWRHKYPQQSDHNAFTGDSSRDPSDDENNKLSPDEGEPTSKEGSAPDTGRTTTNAKGSDNNNDDNRNNNTASGSGNEQTTRVDIALPGTNNGSNEGGYDGRYQGVVCGGTADASTAADMPSGHHHHHHHHHHHQQQNFVNSITQDNEKPENALKKESRNDDDHDKQQQEINAETQIAMDVAAQQQQQQNEVAEVAEALASLRDAGDGHHHHHHHHHHHTYTRREDQKKQSPKHRPDTRSSRRQGATSKEVPLSNTVGAMLSPDQAIAAPHATMTFPAAAAPPPHANPALYALGQEPPPSMSSLQGQQRRFMHALACHPGAAGGNGGGGVLHSYLIPGGFHPMSYPLPWAAAAAAIAAGKQPPFFAAPHEAQSQQLRQGQQHPPERLRPGVQDGASTAKANNNSNSGSGNTTTNKNTSNDTSGDGLPAPPLSHVDLHQAWMQYHQLDQQQHQQRYQLMQMNIAAMAQQGQVQGGVQQPVPPLPWSALAMRPALQGDPGSRSTSLPMYHSTYATVSGGGSAGPSAALATAPAAGTGVHLISNARKHALMKYKEKRKNRELTNASTKIRYHSRKALAEARPRVRGQFVKMIKEVDTDATSHARDGELPPAEKNGRHDNGTRAGDGSDNNQNQSGKDADGALDADGMINKKRGEAMIMKHPSSRDPQQHGTLSGRKHKRQQKKQIPSAIIAAVTKTGGRSDSGSNTPVYDDGSGSPTDNNGATPVKHRRR